MTLGHRVPGIIVPTSTSTFVLAVALLRLLSFARGQNGDADSSNFYVDSNGIVICRDAEVGDTSTLEIEGNTLVFTRVSREDLLRIVAAAAWSELGTVCTSGITDMSNLFIGQVHYGADHQTLGRDVDISHWDVSSVRNMDAMFYGATSFNKDLSSWNTSMVTSCAKFADKAVSWTEPWPEFPNCQYSRFVLGTNGVTVSCPDASLNETGYARGKRYTRRNRQLLEALINQKNWSELAASCTTGIENFGNLFLGEEDFNADISSWDVSAATNMGAMFYDASSFDQNLGVWNVANVTNCDRFAQGTSSWTQNQPVFTRCTPSKFYRHENGVTILCPDAAVLETGTVDGVEYTKRDLDGYFGLRYLAIDSTKWDLLDRTCISGITDLASLFVGAAVLGIEDRYPVTLSTWDTSQVTDMSYLFAGASVFDADISMWDVGMVQDMSNMFVAAYQFNQDIGNWNTSNVRTMERMFYEASAFNQDISGWDTKNVENMHGMFDRARSFNQDLSGWNVDGVQDCDQFSPQADSWVAPQPIFPPLC